MKLEEGKTHIRWVDPQSLKVNNDDECSLQTNVLRTHYIPSPTEFKTALTTKWSVRECAKTVVPVQYPTEARFFFPTSTSLVPSFSSHLRIVTTPPSLFP